MRIAVTRAATQANELAKGLEQAGADVVVCPLIRFEPVALEMARRVLHTLDEFSWLIFTSSNGVDQFMRVLAEAKLNAAVLTGKRVACVGPATAATAAGYGLTTDVMPDDFVGEAVAREIISKGSIRGCKMLIARAAGGGQGLPTALRAHGALVDDLELYKTVPDLDGAARLGDLITAGGVDVLTFTAGSTVTYFVQTVGAPGQAHVAVIGPSTAEIARRNGMRVDIEANPHTTAGLIKAIQEYYAAGRGHWRTNAGE